MNISLFLNKLIYKTSIQYINIKINIKYIKRD